MSAKQAAARRRAAKDPVVSIPDVAGKQTTVEVLHALLYKAARRRVELEAVRIANGHGHDEPVPGEPPTDEDGVVNSYSRLTGQLAEQERRLCEAYPEAVEEVRKMVFERDA